MDETSVPMIGLNQALARGKIIGRFVVTTATNVSRTANEPANCAPLIGS